MSVEVAALATQTITFDNPGDQDFGSTPTLTASADSGLPVSFASTTTGVCSVTGEGTLTFASVGTCTITANQPGNEAYDAATPVTQSFAVQAVAPGAPAIVSVGAGDGQAAIAFSAPGFNGGAEITGYTVTADPGGFSATGLATPIIVSGLSNGTAYTFTVTATNSAGIGTASAASDVVIPYAAVAMLPGTGAALADGTVGSPYSYTGISASGGLGDYAFAASGLPPGLDIDAATGEITGIPSAAGTYTPTITVGTETTGSASATYTIVVAIEAPMAADSTVSVAANSGANTIDLTLSGGPVTDLEVIDQATNGTAVASGGAITYQPNAGFSGADAFTYRVTNASGADTAIVTVTVTPPAFVFHPAPGALAAGLVGDTYDSGPISVTEGGGSYAFTSTGLPPGLSFDGATGAISGTPTAAGDFTVTITAEDRWGATDSATYTIAIAIPEVDFIFTPEGGDLPPAMAGEDYSVSITTDEGVAPLLYSVSDGDLPPGMILSATTGELTGPPNEGAEGDYSFTVQVRDANGSTGEARYRLVVAERVVSVQDHEIDVPQGGVPANIDLADGATGGPFTGAKVVSVQPAAAGKAEIVHTRVAQSAGPTPLQFYLKFTPNPAFSGKAKVSFQLISALGASTGTVTYTLVHDPAEVRAEIFGLVDLFVQSRQSMIASSIAVPNLLERRRMQAATGPATSSLTPAGNGVMLNFATSTAQANAATAAAAGLAEIEPDPFNIWIDATARAFNRSRDDHLWGTFAMLSAGADYLVDDKMLIGLSFHYDHMRDPLDQDALLSGSGWHVGPYASFELGEGVFWDTSLLYGGSSNTIDTQLWDGSFDTSRWLFDTAISGVWQLDELTSLTPKLRAVYLNETVHDYVVDNGLGTTIGMDGFTTEQLRASFGAELARQIDLDGGMVLTPRLGVTGGFSGLDGAGAFGQVSAGISLAAPQAWTITSGLTYSTNAGGTQALGARVGIGGQF